MFVELFSVVLTFAGVGLVAGLGVSLGNPDGSLKGHVDFDRRPLPRLMEDAGG